MITFDIEKICDTAWINDFQYKLILFAYEMILFSSLSPTWKILTLLFTKTTPFLPQNLPHPA